MSRKKAKPVEPPRMHFIPELRARIIADGVKQGIPESSMIRGLQLWESGEIAVTLTEKVCFDVFKQVQAKVEAIP